MGTLRTSIILISRAAHASASHATPKEARRHVLSGSGRLIRGVIAVIPTPPRSLSASPPPHADTPTEVVKRSPDLGRRQHSGDARPGGRLDEQEACARRAKINESASQDIRSISGGLAPAASARYSTRGVGAPSVSP